MATQGPVFAKTIVLGDRGVGRSSLIDNLDVFRTARPLHQYTYSHTHTGSQAHTGPHNGPYAHTHAQLLSAAADAAHGFFTAIELTAEELESVSESHTHTRTHAHTDGNNSDSSAHTHSSAAILKVWEYTQNLSKKDEQLAFRGALFCVVVFDICSAASFQAVFERWIPLKEALSADSFLYIVGTHQDRAHYRQVPLSEICKACAKKDALYVEVSNTEGVNISLLRRLLCRRVEFMMRHKEAFARRTQANSLLSAAPSGLTTMSTEDERERERDRERDSRERNAFEESKVSGYYYPGEQGESSNTHPSPAMSRTSSVGGGGIATGREGEIEELSIPSLESHVLAGSIGSVLSSVLGVSDWQGFVRQEREITQVAERIDALFQSLSRAADEQQNLQSLSLSEEIFRDQENYPNNNNNNKKSSGSAEESGEGEEDEERAREREKDLQELADAFQVLGLSLPPSLAPAVKSSEKTGNNTPNPNNNSNKNKNNTSNNNIAPNNSNKNGGLSPPPFAATRDVDRDRETENYGYHNNGNNNGNNNTSRASSTAPSPAGAVSSTPFLSPSSPSPPPPPPPPPRPAPSSLRKMMVKLPSGQPAELIVDLEQAVEPQIDHFLVQHNMPSHSYSHNSYGNGQTHTESEARRRLVQVCMKLQRDFFESPSVNTRPRSANRSVASSSTNSTLR